MRQVKCQWCSEKSSKKEMTYIETGIKKIVKKYFHPSCLEKYNQDKQYKQQESKALDGLIDTIKEIHELKTIPSQIYPYLNELRNGNSFFGKSGKANKKYKKGYTYTEIEATWKYCQKEISWAKANKEFISTMNELKYALAIVKNKIDIMVKRGRKKNQNIGDNKGLKLIDILKDVKITNTKLKQSQENKDTKDSEQKEKENEINLIDLF